MSRRVKFALLLVVLIVGMGSPVQSEEEPPGSPELTNTTYLPFLKNAPNDLSITQLNYSGSDEVVEVTNNGPGPQSLDGWSIYSAIGSQTYDFSGVSLGVDQRVRIYSGPDAFANPPLDLLWSKAYLWNNDGDRAELYDHNHQLRDSSCYKSGC